MSRAVRNGELVYVSPSQIAKHKQCARSWYYTYVLGFRPPQTESQTKGERSHSQMEAWLLEGKEPVLESGRMFVKDHGALLDTKSTTILVEHPKDKNLGIEVDGTRLVGRLDIIQRQGTVAYVWDWKTTSNLKYAKSGEELLIDPQMCTYAYYVSTLFADVEQFGVGHIYLSTNPDMPGVKVVKAPKLLSRQDVSASYQAFVVPEIYEIKTTCQIEDVEDVPADTGSCFAFGGCPHRFGCSKYRERWGWPKGKDPFNGALTYAGNDNMLGSSTSEADKMALDDLFKMADNVKPEERVNPPDAAEHDPLPQAGTAKGLDLYVDCVFEAGGLSTQRLEDLIEQYARPICERRKVRDVREVKFGEGKVDLLKAFRENPPTGIVLAHTGGMSTDVLEVLIPMARIVVRGVK